MTFTVNFVDLDCSNRPVSLHLLVLFYVLGRLICKHILLLTKYFPRRTRWVSSTSSWVSQSKNYSSFRSPVRLLRSTWIHSSKVLSRLRGLSFNRSFYEQIPTSTIIHDHRWIYSGVLLSIYLCTLRNLRPERISSERIESSRRFSNRYLVYRVPRSGI